MGSFKLSLSVLNSAMSHCWNIVKAWRAVWLIIGAAGNAAPICHEWMWASAKRSKHRAARQSKHRAAGSRKSISRCSVAQCRSSAAFEVIASVLLTLASLGCRASKKSRAHFFAAQSDRNEAQETPDSHRCHLTPSPRPAQAQPCCTLPRRRADQRRNQMIQETRLTNRQLNLRTPSEVLDR